MKKSIAVAGCIALFSFGCNDSPTAPPAEPDSERSVGTAAAESTCFPSEEAVSVSRALVQVTSELRTFLRSRLYEAAIVQAADELVQAATTVRDHLQNGDTCNDILPALDELATAGSDLGTLLNAEGLLEGEITPHQLFRRATDRFEELDRLLHTPGQGDDSGDDQNEEQRPGDSSGGNDPVPEDGDDSPPPDDGDEEDDAPPPDDGGDDAGDEEAEDDERDDREDEGKEKEDKKDEEEKDRKGEKGDKGKKGDRGNDDRGNEGRGNQADDDDHDDRGNDDEDERGHDGGDDEDDDDGDDNRRDGLWWSLRAA